MDASARHLRVLTETIEAVNSSLDLEEVMALVASKVSAALDADACFVYLYDARADELVLRATHGTTVAQMTRRPRLRPGEGITGTAALLREPIMIAAQAHLDPRFKRFTNLPEDQYESILAVPILARDTLAGALNVRTRQSHEFSDDEIELLTALATQVAHSIEHARLYGEAQARVGELEALARISEAVSNSLYLEESLEAIVKTTIRAVKALGASIVLDDGRVVRSEGAGEAAHEARVSLRWKGRQLGELVTLRDREFDDDELTLLGSIAHHAAVAVEQGRAVMRGVLAQEIHHRVKNNLQTVASLLRIQARATDVDPRRALMDSVNRILAIAAVHEALMERRDDDVDLAELVERLRATIVQGVGLGKTVETQLEPVSLAGHAATALALVFAELLQNALEHGGDHVHVELAARGGAIVLAVSDDGPGMPPGGPAGTGLSIVQALVRDELRGDLVFAANGSGRGVRAEVTFPAG